MTTDPYAETDDWIVPATRPHSDAQPVSAPEPSGSTPEAGEGARVARYAESLIPNTGEVWTDTPDDAPPRIPDRCTCGAPEAYSLNPAEVVTHRTDGPCTIGPAGERPKRHHHSRGILQCTHLDGDCCQECCEPGGVAEADVWRDAANDAENWNREDGR